MNKQINLSFFSDELKEVKTHKKEFLEQIERIMPWGELEELVRPCYYEGKRGNKPYDLELMLRIHLLQNLYNLSDEGTRNEVIDSRAFSDFCGVESSNQIPDGDTIGRFRNLLINNHIHEQFFALVVKTLTDRGLILKKGTIVDSTIIEAPSSTKNKEKQRDPDAHSVKKGSFGYKAHVGVDKDSGIVHTLEVTGANEHDVSMTSKLLTDEEEVVYGDSGYLGAEKREDAVTKNKQGKKIRYKVNRRPSQYKKNSKRSQAQMNPVCEAIKKELFDLLSDDIRKLWAKTKNRVPKHVDEAEYFVHAGAMGAYVKAQLLAIVNKELLPYPVVVGKTPLIYIAYRKKDM